MESNKFSLFSRASRLMAGDAAARAERGRAARVIPLNVFLMPYVSFWNIASIKTRGTSSRIVRFYERDALIVRRMSGRDYNSSLEKWLVSHSESFTH